MTTNNPSVENWQYKIDAKWINCSPENCRILQQRKIEPSLEEIFLQNDHGLLCGFPEKHEMQFRFNNNPGKIHTSDVRIGIREGESAIHVIEYVNSCNDTRSHIMIPPKAQRLVTQVVTLPNDKGHLDVQIGTDCLVAHNGIIWMKEYNGNLARCRYGYTDLSYSQYNEMTSSRYSWSFQGPFRKKRMFMAVEKTAQELDQRLQLRDVYDRVFDENDEDATEYGPYQFQDLLISRGEYETATVLMDNYHSIPSDKWKSFSGLQNVKIEEFRKKKVPGVKIAIGGEIYMIVFDTGAGSSGSNAVLIRPSRYNKILTAIEDQFQEDSLRELFTALVAAGIDPIYFLNLEQDEINEILTDDQTVNIKPLLHKVQHSTEYMSTLIQQLMPTLLNKFKECEIKMVNEETINEKSLCKKIVDTLHDGGLSVPIGQTQTFKEMIFFIHTQQSWLVPAVANSVKQCDICLDSESTCVMSHCGQNAACMKCWSDSLVENNMKCMFCRQEVVEKSLKILTTKAAVTRESGAERAPVRRSKRKRKRINV